MDDHGRHTSGFQSMYPGSYGRKTNIVFDGLDQIEIDLTNREVKVLSALMEHECRVLSKPELLDKLAHEDSEQEPLTGQALYDTLRRLRQKLGTAPPKLENGTVPSEPLQQPERVNEVGKERHTIVPPPCVPALVHRVGFLVMLVISALWRLMRISRATVSDGTADQAMDEAWREAYAALNKAADLLPPAERLEYLQIAIDKLHLKTASATTAKDVACAVQSATLATLDAAGRARFHLNPPLRHRPPSRSLPLLLGTVSAGALVGALGILAIVSDILQVQSAHLTGLVLVALLCALVVGTAARGWLAWHKSRRLP